MSSDGRKLPVHERFHSWQGEGVHMGKSAYFIRLFGCPVHCPWCDSAGTWHPDFVPRNIERFSGLELAEVAKESGAKIAIITGGEPAIHDLSGLASELGKRGIRRHLETSGAFELRGEFDWVTVSPKWQKLPLAAVLEVASEFKLIVENENSIENWIQEIGDYFRKDKPVWLHPEWSQKDSPGVLEAITRTVKEKGDPFRAGYQLHKLYHADQLDPNSRDSVPLGGDEKKGY